MKALDDTTGIRQSLIAATDLAACVTTIFERYSILCGFTVQPHATLTTDRAMAQLPRGLSLADVEVNSPPGYRPTQEFCDEIAAMLLDLMDKQPAVLDFLSGCTFARTFH
jgi:hypothetical protein